MALLTPQRHDHADRVARMAETDDRVELTDLDVIARYSLAVRTATADRNELIAALRSDLDWLEGSSRRRAPQAEPRRAAPPAPATTPPPRAKRAQPAKKAAKK